MNLYKYEFKKVFQSRFAVVLFLLLVVFNCVAGLMTEEDARQEAYAEQYRQEIENIIYNEKMNYISIEDKESENAQYQVEIVSRYTAIQTLDVSQPVKGFGAVLSSPVAFVSALFVGIFTAMMLAYHEYSASLILSSYHRSRGRLCLSKILLLLTVSFCSVLLYVGLNTVGVAIGSGLSGAALPVQSIPEYMNCPYPFTVLQVLLLRILFASLMVFLVSLAVLLFGVIVRRAVWTLLCAVLLLGSDFLLTYIHEKDIFSLFYNFNIRSFLMDGWLRKYSGMQLFSFASQLAIFGVMAIALLLVLGGLIFLLFRYAKVVQSVKSKMSARHHAACFEKNLFFYESKKILSGKVILAWVLLLAASLFIKNASIQPENRDLERIYRYYVDQMTGMTYEDQVSYSLTTKINLNQIINEEKTMREQYLNGEATLEAYTEAQKRAGAAELEIEVLQTIDKQLNTIGEWNEKGIEAKLVYSTGWKMLMQNSSNLFLLFAVILVVVPYLSMENETGFQAILSGVFLHQKRSLQRFHAVQVSLTLMYALLITLVFHLAELLLIDSAYGLPNWTAYAVGAELIFQNVHFRLVDAVLMRELFSVIGIVMLILVTKLLTMFIKRAVFIILLIAAVEILFYLISMSSDWAYGAGILPYFGFELFYLPIIRLIVQAVVGFVVLTIVFVLHRKYKQKI